MRYKDAIDLISIVYSTNDLGNITETRTKKTVFAYKKSIRQSEFYQAQATGLKPELMFQTWDTDYDNETILEYDGKEYSIIRTYAKNDKSIELVCTGIVGTEVR